MPTTLLTTPITQLVSNPEKIMFILQKTIEEKMYQKILYEIKNDLLKEKYTLLPQNIQDIICLLYTSSSGSHSPVCPRNACRRR